MRTEPASRRQSSLPHARRAERGAALLVVIVSIAILTAIAVDLAYSTRVSLLTAANARDELRAEYMARGAAQLSRLVLKFQIGLDDLPPAPAIGRLQVWNIVPISSDLAAGLFAGEEGGEGGLPSGKFEAKLEDEGRKVNAQLDGTEGDGVLFAQVTSLLHLVRDPRWDPLFEREDENGLRVTRPDLAVYLRDWTDPGSVTSGLDLANRGKPFADAFGDENQPYSRGDDRYQTKNARFDSLDELYLVAGIDDAFMTAFGSKLTVYPDVNGQININATDPQELKLRAIIIADERGLARIEDPKFPDDLAQKVALVTYGGMVSLTEQQFADIVEFLGVPVNPAYRAAIGQKSARIFTDRSYVYRIRATGTAGAVERKLDAVVTFNPNMTRQEPGAEIGRLLHWREE